MGAAKRVVVAATRAEAAVAIIAAAAATAVAAGGEAVAVAAAKTATAVAMLVVMAGEGQDERERRPEGGIGGSTFADLILQMHIYQYFYLLTISAFSTCIWRGFKFSQININLYVPQIGVEGITCFGNGCYSYKLQVLYWLQLQFHSFTQ